MNPTKSLLLVALLLLVASRVSAQGADRYIVNHFVNDPAVIDAHLVITDVEGNGPIVTMKFHDNDGKLIGEGKELLQPFGKLNLDPGKYVSKVANGTIHIASQGGNIVAEYWQFYKNASESWKNTTTVGQDAAGYTKLVCPHFVSDPDVEVYLVLANPDGKDAIVNVVFHDDNGREVGKAREMVKANGKIALQPWGIVKTKANGVAFISAQGGKITADYWQAEKAKSYQIAIPVAGI
ncbi:MAG: hypothetical protein KFF77_05825 [Bacteroidetes bacterium]|nr:hypothetical protein [Bacteroidota bacterium]